MSSSHPKSEMVLKMKVNSLKMHNSVALFADTDSNMNLSHAERVATAIDLIKTINRSGSLKERGENTKDINLRTTKHYYYGHLILRAMRRRRKNNASSIEG